MVGVTEPQTGWLLFLVLQPAGVMMPRVKHRAQTILLSVLFLAAVPAAKAAPDQTVPVPGDAPGSWTAPRPPYPAVARIKREQGTIFLKVTTDAHGRVINAAASVAANEKHDLSDLAAVSVKWALAYWYGPPKVTRKMKFEFRLM